MQRIIFSVEMQYIASHVIRYIASHVIDKLFNSIRWRFLYQVLLVAIFVIGCQNFQSREPQVSPTPDVAAKNCVTNYNPEQDYFPDKASVKYAQGFTVEYRNHYQIVTIKKPWQKANQDFQYILVQCGTPTPEDFPQAQKINIPVNSIVTLSTTHLPHLASLDVVDKLVGVSDTNRVNTPQVVEKIKTGKVASVGNNSNLNIEKILELNPDLVTTYGTGNAQIDSHPKLLEAGLKVAINAEYMENSPLGRSEWLKFTALFFHQEKRAEEIFNRISAKYQEIAKKAKAVNNLPRVFTGFNFKGTWYVPGCKSYVAQYFADAGADLLCIENVDGSVPLSFEDVFDRAANADYWLNVSQNWQSIKDILTEDKRYGDFKAVKLGNVYNNNLRLNEGGGNDYWESGISNPDVVLADLIRILHPEILPQHQLFYYQKLQ